MKRIVAVALAFALSVLAPAAALAAYTNDGSGATVIGGKDSTGLPHTGLTDTSGRFIVVTSSGGTVTVVGNLGQNSSTTNQAIAVLPVIYETTPTTLTSGNVSYAEADSTGHVIVVGTAATGAAVSLNPVYVAGRDVAGNVQPLPVTGNGAAITTTSILVAGKDNVNSQQPFNVVAVGTTSNQATLAVQGAVADAVGTAQADPVLIGGWSYANAGPTVRGVTVTPSNTTITGVVPNTLVIGGMDSTITNGKIQVLSVIPVAGTTANTLNLGMVGGVDGGNVARTLPIAVTAAAVPLNTVQVGGKDASGNEQPLNVPGVGLGNNISTLATQGPTSDSGVNEPNPLMGGGWQPGGTAQVRSLNVTARGTVVSLNPNVLITGGEADVNGNAQPFTVSPNNAIASTPTGVLTGGYDGNKNWITTIGQTGVALTGTANVTIIGGTTAASGGTAYALTVSPNNTTLTPNGMMSAGYDGTASRIITVAPNNTAVTLATTQGQVIAGNNNGTVFDADVVPAGTAVTGTTNLLMVGAADGTSARQLSAGLNNTAEALASTTGLVIGGNNNGTIFDLDVVPVGTAVTTTANAAIIGGEDDSTAGAGNARAFTVATSGTAFGGTTPTALMIGGEDNTATNGVPRVMRVASATGTFNGGEVETVDASEFALALGAPTNTALTSNTSVSVGTVAAGKCWQLICAVDVTYRVTNGASTAVATDMELPAKTTLTKCSGSSTQTALTVLPSATSSAAAPAFGGCSFAILQSPL